MGGAKRRAKVFLREKGDVLLSLLSSRSSGPSLCLSPLEAVVRQNFPCSPFPGTVYTDVCMAVFGECMLTTSNSPITRASR